MAEGESWLTSGSDNIRDVKAGEDLDLKNN